ncbi:MAG: metalloregulator ArsR/SmtB family transcription factor [Syntrophomonadaceae bacterium]|nr:metalloregulator ArsR/SmtB family transcription factor [Syntrophomonadaceae bacterium]MDH7497400.1 metalloregulator ArsR/SmtB family transcription factor [Syntrophomonadaceae bacterium]
MIQRVSTVLKALGEPTRLAIVRLLSVRELCICELTAILDMSQPRISQHVKVLKQAGLVKERRVRQRTYFSLNAAELRDGDLWVLSELFSASLEEIPELRAASQRFAQLDQDPRVRQCRGAAPEGGLSRAAGRAQ